MNRDDGDVCHTELSRNAARRYGSVLRLRSVRVTRIKRLTRLDSTSGNESNLQCVLCFFIEPSCRNTEIQNVCRIFGPTNKNKRFCVFHAYIPCEQTEPNVSNVLWFRFGIQTNRCESTLRFLGAVYGTSWIKPNRIKCSVLDVLLGVCRPLLKREPTNPSCERQMQKQNAWGETRRTTEGKYLLG